MAEENLKINFHRKQLVLKALNVKPNRAEAALALSISIKTLQRDIKRFKIRCIDNTYQTCTPIIFKLNKS